MRKMLWVYGLALVISSSVVGLSGCSKTAVQSGGEGQGTQGAATGATPTSPSSDRSTSSADSFPDTTMQASSGGLRGLDKNPSEERVAGNSTMVAKAESSSSSAQQAVDTRAEQEALAATGLRDVLFGYDSWTISEDARQALIRNADWMKSNARAKVKVEGHCDERGTTAYNLVLGEKRAKAVRNYLVELGISANRLSVVSFGKEQPICTEHTDSCYQRNRRGHLAVKTGK
ncbi:MAG: peptidoglycan-associated lipoprotein Pal [Nitrospira sp.]|nr:peptidoglycan-associated lipoprotein Pal [Nitrospira sp.]